MTWAAKRSRSAGVLAAVAASVLLADLATVAAMRQDGVRVAVTAAPTRPVTAPSAGASSAPAVAAVPRSPAPRASRVARSRPSAASPAATGPAPSVSRELPATSPSAEPGPTAPGPGSTDHEIPPTAPLLVDTHLSWKPPTLAADHVTRQITQGERVMKLDPDKDYLLRLPKDAPLLVDDGFQIVGGRNVVLIGGEVRNRKGGRHLFVRGTSGVTRPRTVHLEGVRFTAATGVTMTEGINIDAQGEPGLTVRLQNVKLSRIQGSYEGVHADLIQNWNGPHALQVDRFVGETTYQGVMHQPNLFGDGPYGQYVFRRVWFNGPKSGSMMYYKDKDGQPPVVIDRFFVTPNPDKVYPSQALYGLTDRASEFTRLTPGTTPPIDILTGRPGVGYVSPGY